ncbi:VCBS repeat-containing protein [Streptomyces sp. NBC_00237]|uniref:VCBS repeat-containing protein n=1 Tax=Streptomyces sp. NBC_00237 TaxID=2975687 RepID=UPI00225826F4|nr:VCBS repeat-containing protein [Streptomyces sp. NBC_00237]MCX5203134.1 VCBS repeat-containing protein [Streptomyces sp. NBC_00237]
MPQIFTRRWASARRSIPALLAATVAGSSLGLVPLGLSPAASDVRQTGPAGEAGEEGALAKARLTGEPVEIMSERSEASETHALPNGNLRRTQHTAPVRVKREGVWSPIDTTLAAVAGRVSPKAAAGKVTFSAGGSAPLVMITDQGRSVSLTWPKPLPAPVLEGSTATYSEVLPGVDLALAAGVDGFSQALIVKTAEAAANPELATIDFGLKTEGLNLKQDPAAGTLSAANEAGQTLFTTSTARMWDSSGKDESAPAGLTRSKSASPGVRAPSDLTPGTNSSTVDVDFTSNRLTLTPDQELLKSPDTTYPVYIDPRMTGTRQAWTIAYKPHPNDSYFNGTGWSGGTTSEARVGYESSSGGTARSFFRVDSKFLARVKVIDAQFQITETHSWSCTAKPVELYLTGSISSATTWNKQPSWSTRQDSRNYAHGNESFGCPDKAVDFTAKDAAVKAAAGSWSDITFGLRAPQSAEDGKDAYSWKKFKPDAKLIVEFNRAPKNPWALDTIPSTRISSTDCGNGATYMTVGNTDVTLNAQVWDQDGGDVNVEFLVWPTGKYAGDPGIIFDKRVRKTVIASDSKGVRASIVVPKALLSQHMAASGGQFSWKAQAEDVGDSTFASDWTPTAGASGCRFGFDPTAPSVMPTVTSVNGLYPEDSEGALARTEGQFVLGSGGEKDIAEYRWALDRTPPNNIEKPATAGASVTIKLTPLTPGPHTLYVQSFDAGKNPGPRYPYKFYVKSPGIVDKPGDVNGDSQPDMFAIDSTNNLRLYSGAGAGAVDTGLPISTNASWGAALLTHRSDWNEDLYEDLVARKSDGKLWFYPNDGIGGFTEDTKEEIYFFPDSQTGLALDPATFKQIVSIGDITPGEGGSNPDFVAVIGDQLWFLPGYSSSNIQAGYPIGGSGWSNLQLSSPGDVDGDGFTDLIARNTTTGEVGLYHGKSNGDADGDNIPDGGTDPSSLGAGSSRTAYATGWTTTARPLITATGDSNGDGIGDFWTTTANTNAGLEFVPGRKSGLLGSPTVVGTGGWQAVKGIF